VKTIFIMVKCELGKAYAVADAAVSSIEQVSEVYSTSGKYDLLMKVVSAGHGRHRAFRHGTATDAGWRQGHVYDHRVQGVSHGFGSLTAIVPFLLAFPGGRCDPAVDDPEG
jgi:Lrp/AsnC ligand binding domain